MSQETMQKPHFRVGDLYVVENEARPYTDYMCVLEANHLSNMVKVGILREHGENDFSFNVEGRSERNALFNSDVVHIRKATAEERQKVFEIAVEVAFENYGTFANKFRDSLLGKTSTFEDIAKHIDPKQYQEIVDIAEQEREAEIEFVRQQTKWGNREVVKTPYPENLICVFNQKYHTEVGDYVEQSVIEQLQHPNVQAVMEAYRNGSDFHAAFNKRLSDAMPLNDLVYLQIVKMRCEAKMTFEQIGKEFNINATRASQKYSKGIRKFRPSIKKYFDEILSLANKEGKELFDTQVAIGLYDNVPNEGKIYANLTDAQYDAVADFLNTGDAAGHSVYEQTADVKGTLDCITLDNSVTYAEFQNFAEKEGIKVFETEEEALKALDNRDMTD